MSAVNAVCYSADRIITEHIEAVTSAESILQTDRDIQEFLNNVNSEQAEMLKVNYTTLYNYLKQKVKINILII